MTRSDKLALMAANMERIWIVEWRFEGNEKWSTSSEAPFGSRDAAMKYAEKLETRGFHARAISFIREVESRQPQLNCTHHICNECTTKVQLADMATIRSAALDEVSHECMKLIPKYDTKAEVKVLDDVVKIIEALKSQPSKEEK